MATGAMDGMPIAAAYRQPAGELKIGKISANFSAEELTIQRAVNHKTEHAGVRLLNRKTKNSNGARINFVVTNQTIPTWTILR
jgi:hypothetical protein